MCKNLMLKIVQYQQKMLGEFGKFNIISLLKCPARLDLTREKPFLNG